MKHILCPKHSFFKSVLDINKSDFISSSINTRNLEAMTKPRSAHSTIYTSQNKEKLFSYTRSCDWFLKQRLRKFLHCAT
jgi:hypothetical protein